MPGAWRQGDCCGAVPRSSYWFFDFSSPEARKIDTQRSPDCDSQRLRPAVPADQAVRPLFAVAPTGLFPTPHSHSQALACVCASQRVREGCKCFSCGVAARDGLSLRRAPTNILAVALFRAPRAIEARFHDQIGDIEIVCYLTDHTPPTDTIVPPSLKDPRTPRCPADE